MSDAFIFGSILQFLLKLEGYQDALQIENSTGISVLFVLSFFIGYTFDTKEKCRVYRSSGNHPYPAHRISGQCSFIFHIYSRT